MFGVSKEQERAEDARQKSLREAHSRNGKLITIMLATVVLCGVTAYSDTRGYGIWVGLFIIVIAFWAFDRSAEPDHR
jgi:hypothetical protein